MTSIPASRRARAMIFAPRSWPSRPGFATTTLIFPATVGQYRNGETHRRRLLPRVAEPRRRAFGVSARACRPPTARRLRAGGPLAPSRGGRVAEDRRDRDHAFPPRPL